MSEPSYRLPQQRRIVTALPGPVSLSLAGRRDAVVSAGVASSSPCYVVGADGGILVDADGNQLIDLGAGIAVTTVGASAPAVVAAVAQAAANFTHTCFMVSPYESYVRVCELLAAKTPGTFAKKSALFNSGSEAVENAVKIARRATGRDAVVCFDHAYHGRTALAMALTAKQAPYKSGFGPFPGEVYRMPMNYPFREPAPIGGVEAALRAINQIEIQIGADHLSSILIEPIQGEGGFIVPSEGFLPTLAAWCRANDVVLIADEVQTGFCRTGRWFACEYEGVEPDLICTAKGIAGGLPLSAVTGRAELMDAVQPGGLGGTYGGNPIACAAAVAAIETMTDLKLADRALRIGEIITEVLGPLLGSVATVGELRGRGAMQAIEFVKPGTWEPNPAVAKAVAATCLAQGVLVLTCGTWGNIVRLLPPLVIGEELLRDGLEVLAEAIQQHS
ncbi:4-aminobutyrate--2-oxoglutarate transaminase [Brooklawnia propionicigenes]|jgi:4-aminobutyrate aminotransferase/(S)-3-amino-2-methylpropionate transaminase|uniref:(S)-3-amino-2-methylpropionate transaminase n=1 Tax=Brooklawnia propionicigenes TaxID=3041175 RepID=A0AAN0K7C8_9ACTN|nr:4-aminobutyrate--2-oxoglutarate transaminase [Brooklawnia sp. SH051]BEH01371.1 4-aminobutyrate--2-oxoglutarate transaminase [Brooklawnia sp. SH051]